MRETHYTEGQRLLAAIIVGLVGMVIGIILGAFVIKSDDEKCRDAAQNFAYSTIENGPMDPVTDQAVFDFIVACDLPVPEGRR